MPLKYPLTLLATLLFTANVMAATPAAKSPDKDYFELAISIAPNNQPAPNVPLFQKYQLTIFNGHCTNISRMYASEQAEIAVCGHENADHSVTIATRYETNYADLDTKRWVYVSEQNLVFGTPQFSQLSNLDTGEPVPGSIAYLVRQ